MIDVKSLELIPGSSEEKIAGMEADFPYVASRAELDRYSIPWHWHEQVELFYVESGALEYFTPNGAWKFPAGTGGFVNRNVLHRTEPFAKEEPTVQLLHIFDLSLLSGQPHGRIEQRYFSAPLRNVEIIPIASDQTALVQRLRDSFSLRSNEFGYEMDVCAALLAIWKQIISLATESTASSVHGFLGSDEKIKQMMAFIHNHYSDRISVNDIASAGFVSQRECFRVFAEYVQCTPVRYLISYRLHMACRMLLSGDPSVTQIAHTCGFGNSSYFGKKFLEHFGCTPNQYRRHWQDKTMIRQS